MDLDITCKECYLFYISSNELLELCMILFIPKLKRNASFPTCSKSAPGKKYELTCIKLAYKQFYDLKISNRSQLSRIKQISWFWNIPSSDALENTLRCQERCFCPFVRIWVEYSESMTIIDTKIWFLWFWLVQIWCYLKKH